MWFLIPTVLIITLIYWKILDIYSYWQERGVKYRPPVYVLGDMAGVILRLESIFDFLKNVYDAFPEERYVGSYHFIKPSLMLREPELIKQVLVKDFDHFVDHKEIVPEGTDPLWSENLFALKGDRWRDLRSTVSPSFTSSKMKAMFGIISDCAVDFNKYFLEKGDAVTTVELKDTFTRYTNDVIASAVFGVKCDSLKERDNEFYVMGKNATSFTFKKNMTYFAYYLSPRFCRAVGLSLFPKSVNDFFVGLVNDTMRYRKENGIFRPDMLHLLMEAQKGRLKQEEGADAVDTGFATAQDSGDTAARKPAKRAITDLDIAAQAVVFFFGGFETVSSLMCFLGHELAVNPDVQGRLQEEVDATRRRCGDAVTYDALMNMKYLDMVVSETLRKWPPIVGTDRVCTKPYTIEAARAGERPVELKKGAIITVAISGLHRDPKYFPEPDRFDPERFGDENRGNVKPYTYMPFGVGPRGCIGSRFALLEAKVVYFYLLSKFDLVVVNETQIPLKLSKKSITVESEKGFWVGLKPRVANK